MTRWKRPAHLALSVFVIGRPAPSARCCSGRTAVQGCRMARILMVMCDRLTAGPLLTLSYTGRQRA